MQAQAKKVILAGEEDFGGFLDKAQVMVKPHTSVEYHLYLNGRIRNDADYYLQHYAVYQNATPNDVVILHICSEGGSCSTGTQYIDHMSMCEAPIKAIIGMECASMASAIALAADAWQLSEMSTMLVHGFSYGAQGHEAAVYNQAKFNNRLNERWMRTNYTGFLTEEEIIDCLKGVDLLLDSDELAERFERLAEIRNAQLLQGIETVEDFLDDEDEEIVESPQPKRKARSKN